MLTKLSSKGQVVLPREVRQALHLRPGAHFDVRITDGTIVLRPLEESPVQALRGKFAGAGLLDALEAEHRHEVERDRAIRS